MKTQIQTKCRKNPFLLGLAITAMISVSPSALASTPKWAKDYIGQLNFKLVEDQGLQRRKQNLSQAQDRFQRISNVVQEKSVAANKLLKQKKENKVLINKLTQEITNLVNQKTTLKNQKKSLKTKSVKVSEEIKVASAAVKGATNTFAQSETKVKSLEEKLSQAQTNCVATPTPKCKKQVTKIAQRLEAKKLESAENKKVLDLSNKNLVAKQKTKTDLEAKITATKKKIVEAEASSVNKAKKVSSLQAKQKIVIANSTKAQQELKPLILKKRQVKKKLVEAEDAKFNYRKNLIARVLEVNKKGAIEGSNDGHEDGLILAEDLGQDYGHEDGQEDGDESGVVAGRERDRLQGYRSGQVAGADRAQLEGEADGVKNGTIQGNKDAAQREGGAAGVARANKSDAAQVGIQQGRTDGFDRSVNTGNSEGTKLGEAQAIAKNESQSLKNVTVDGEFSGAFDRYVPRYPARVQRGENFHNRPNYKRSIVNLAYKEGYATRYKRGHRVSYINSIDAVYNDQYDQSYESSYQSAFSQDYPQDRANGYNSGETNAFNRDFPGIYRAYYDQSRNRLNSNPNRRSSEYKYTYKQTELSSYNARYESIRIANYSKTELDTFNLNIGEQTEKYRALRFSAVQSIYEKNPVLEYVSSKMQDGGIDGVAKHDGVFQPNETTLHSVTVINYGKTAATSAKVVLNNGQSFKLPSIAAQSKVTIKGAAKSVVEARLGSLNQKGMIVYSPITAESKIQARHYHNSANAQLNSMDVKKATVKYPLALSSLGTKSTPLINQPIALSVSVMNNSSRSYEGELEVVVDVDSNTNILTKAFANINKLESSAVLSDARVLVASEQDVYQPLTFTAKIMKNGVLLGQVNRSFKTMAKSPYTEKSNAPVILVNSNSSTNDLIEVLDQLGGLKNVSVLDSSLESLNSKTFAQGLKSKTILTLSNGAKSSVDKIVKSSKDSVLIFLNRRGLDDAKSLSSFKQAMSVDYFLKGTEGATTFMFSNPLEVKGLKAPITVMQSSIETYKQLMTMASYLKLNNDQLLNKIKTTFNAKNFFENTAAKRQLLHAGLIRGLDETTRISKHYDNSGNWTNRNKKIVDKVYNSEYFHTKLSNAVKSNPKSSTVGLYMFAHDFYESLRNALKYYRPISKNVMSKLRARLFDGKLFSKSAALKPLKKSKSKLKKKFKNEYKKISKNRGYIAPFILAKESNNNGSRH